MPKRAEKYGYKWTDEEVDMVLGANAAPRYGGQEGPSERDPAQVWLAPALSTSSQLLMATVNHVRH